SMFLRSLTIQNLRAIEDVRLSFDSPTVDARKWTLILGENGCGKSTVLRAAALMFAGTDALPHLLGGEMDSWVRFGAQEATISAVIEPARHQTREISLRLRRGVTIGVLFSDNHESLSLLDAAIKHSSRNYLTVGYGASRRLNLDPNSFTKNRTTPV